MTPELVSISVRQGAQQESQSGLQMMNPKIWGVFRRPPGARCAAIVIHPTSNFHAHYLLEPLAQRGIATLGLNTRYAGNDTVLILERAIQDVGAGVKWLRSQGIDRVLLIGNSGGGALVSFYQAQAEKPDITHTPAGDPIEQLPEDMPPANGIALSAAHLGRSRIFETWIDPSLIDELDLFGTDPSLDMFNPNNGPPYSQDFMAKYRAAQKQRIARITAWVDAKLRQLRALPEGPRDMAFIIHRTLADPRNLDPTLDPNGRVPGMTIWGPARQLNYAANSMGRYTSLTGFLSQWSPRSRGDGPGNVARTRVPVLLFEHMADASTFPSENDIWAAAAGSRIQRHRLDGADHYLAGRPDLVAETADRMASFAERL